MAEKSEDLQFAHSMTTLSYESPQTPIEITKCRTGLIVFGIILILMGLCMGCLATATPLAALMMRRLPNASAQTQAQLPIRTVIVSVLMYSALAGGFVWVGIGSLRSRRWVNPIVVAASCITLFIGIFVLLAISISIPRMREIMQANARSTGTPTPTWLVTAAASFGILFGLIVYLVIPAVFLWFYRRPIVRQTAEFLDPFPRWTDSLPQSIITMALATTLAAFSMGLTLSHGSVPAFGSVWTGIPAVIVLSLITLALIAAALLTIQRRPAGWWLTIAVILIFSLSSITNAILLNPDDFYRAMNLPAGQVEAIRASGIQDPVLTAAFGAITSAAFLAFVIRAKRHFNFAGSASASTPA